jgi:hypothetical protein
VNAIMRHYGEFEVHLPAMLHAGVVSRVVV